MEFQVGDGIDIMTMHGQQRLGNEEWLCVKLKQKYTCENRWYHVNRVRNATKGEIDLVR